MPTKLPNFAEYRKQAMADGRITFSEAKRLTQIATERLKESKHPGPTMDMFGAQMDKMESMATNDSARNQLGYWKQFTANTIVTDRAQKDITAYINSHQGQLPSPMSSIPMDGKADYKAVANENWEGAEMPGGIVTTDNSSDAEYLRIPMDVTKLGMTGKESQDDLDRYMGQAQEAFNNWVASTPELKYSGAWGDVVLVVPKPATEPASK